MPKITRQRYGTYLANFDFTKGGDLAATLNMYCSHKGGQALESFPGFRCLTQLNAKIHSICFLDAGDDSYLVHAGDALYVCSFINDYKDIISRRKLCEMADAESFAFRISGKIYFIDGDDITVVNTDTSTQKLSENPELAYVPTTYVNGEEAEQINILSDLFKEKAVGISSLDYALGSDELIYKIVSETEGTCAVCGAEEISSGRADIPGRKMINGKYYRVTEISEGAFKNNTNIKNIILSPTVKKVGRQAFLGCTSLISVVMPDGIAEIDSSAFAGCTSLTSVYLGTSCESIYYNAFDNCSSLKNVYISGKQEDVANCDGFGILLNYSILYNYKYTDFYLGIPFFTPAKSISEVLVNGSAVSYTYSINSGIISLSCEECGSLEGANITISGEIDRTRALNSERKTPLSLLLSKDAREAVISAKGAEAFDGRVMLYGSPYAKSIALTTSKPISGDTELLYFGELDYFAAGSSEYSISHITSMAKYIIISKRDEMGGSIFVYTPKGSADAAFGRDYELLFKRVKLGIRSDVVIYHWMAHYAADDGVYRMKLSSASPTIERVSSGDVFDIRYASGALAELMREHYADAYDSSEAEIIIDTFADFLVIIKGDIMLLGDIRLPKKAEGVTGYTWFTMCDVGAYTNEQTVYRFAESAPKGFYIHPDAGEVCDGTVYSVAGSDGSLIYYTNIGIRRYAVVPTEERCGGDFSPITSILPCKETLIFGTEAGHILAANTDKVGVPPPRIYEADDFDAEEYRKSRGAVIHPDFYTYNQRSVLCAAVSEDCDGDAPYLNKRSGSTGLCARLERRSAEAVHFASVTDGEKIACTDEMPMGELDFSDFNFALLSMEFKESEIISILEGQEKWVNKQIIVYTSGAKSPFAIRGFSFGFQISSKIRNH